MWYLKTKIFLGDKTDGKEGAADSSTDKGKETDVERRRSRDRSHLSDRARRELDVLSFEKIKVGLLFSIYCVY